MDGAKTQSALEYLSIYGTALLIIAAAASALYLLGVYSPQNNVIGTCSFSGAFGCSDLKLGSTGVLQFNLVNTGQYPVYVSGLGCNANKSVINIVRIAGPQNNSIYIPTGSSSTFTVQCYIGTNKFAANIGSAFTGYLILNYTDQYTRVKKTTFGNINTKVVSGAIIQTTFTTSTSTTI
ncbi:MAG: hypothetical protein KGI00_01065 [Candidatus Micrarchaeota archaeon]|nr:hypothetical protein [Candidatus Micrarchaeota archaeon]MDE1849298.1 hypothetical protein [Candidatus Micrarchaeota archaeon]